jgi:hypothetical protein
LAQAVGRKAVIPFEKPHRNIPFRGAEWLPVPEGRAAAPCSFLWLSQTFLPSGEFQQEHLRCQERENLKRHPRKSEKALLGKYHLIIRESAPTVILKKNSLGKFHLQVCILCLDI